MSRIRSHSQIAAMLVAVVAPAASKAQSTPNAPSTGISYTMTMRIDSGTTPVTTRMHYAFSGRKVRMEITADAPAMAATGPFSMIINGDDSTMTNIIPAQRTAMILPLSGRMRDLIKNAAISIDASRLTFGDPVDLGAGQPVAGHATHGYRVVASGVLTTKIGGQSCEQPVDNVTETWIASDLDLESHLRELVSLLGTARDAIDPASQLGLAKAKLPRGTPMRSTTRSSYVDAAGARRSVTTIMEITDVAQGPIADSVFAVPADMRTMDMRSMMQMVPPGAFDSISASRAGQSKGLCPGSKAP